VASLRFPCIESTPFGATPPAVRAARGHLLFCKQTVWQMPPTQSVWDRHPLEVRLDQGGRLRRRVWPCWSGPTLAIGAIMDYAQYIDEHLAASRALRKEGSQELWRMTAAQRRAAMHAGELTWGQVCEWAVGRAPDGAPTGEPRHAATVVTTDARVPTEVVDEIVASEGFLEGRSAVLN
jgi:hypothetical protein